MIILLEGFILQYVYNNVHKLYMKKLDPHSNKPIQLQVALVPVCKMVIRFGLHFHEFVRNLQKAYIHAAEEILSEVNIKPSLQAIAIKTGMDRRTISEHKNNLHRNYTNPMNKMDMIIAQLQLAFSQKDNEILSRSELQKIIDAIYAQHIRSNAIVKELLTNKIIKKLDNGHYKLNLTLPEQLNTIRMMADDVDITAKRLFQTYYKNMFVSTADQTNLLQTTHSSTKVAPRFHQEVNQQLHQELLKTEKRIKAIIEKHESHVAEGTYPELGVTQFQFNSINNSQ